MSDDNLYTQIDTAKKFTGDLVDLSADRVSMCEIGLKLAGRLADKPTTVDPIPMKPIVPVPN